MNNPLWQAFLESGLVGQTILVILFALSIGVWAVAASKFYMLYKIRRSNRDFLGRYHSAGTPLSPPGAPEPSALFAPLAYLHREGEKELRKAGGGHNPGGPASDKLERIRKELRERARDRLEAMEEYLILLASSASTGPLLGILGTVWGVLIAFRGMGRYGSATIEAVAPGISEALITTVAGLVVAIPALVFYNYFNHAFNKLGDEMGRFIEEFIDRAAGAGEMRSGGKRAGSR